MDIQITCGTRTDEHRAKQPQTSEMLTGPRAKRTVFPSALPFTNGIWDCIRGYQAGDRMRVCQLPGFRKTDFGLGGCPEAVVCVQIALCLHCSSFGLESWVKISCSDGGETGNQQTWLSPHSAQDNAYLPQLCNGIPSSCDIVGLLKWSLKAGRGALCSARTLEMESTQPIRGAAA